MGTPLPVGAAVLPGTLRAKIEELRATGKPFTLRQAIGIIVPICVEAADRHAAGESLLLHPSSIALDDLGHYSIAPGLSSQPPVLPRDKACLAPEERAGGSGNARASVYAVGAMLYELVTGLSVGPGMRRPTEVVPTLPPALEAVLVKALVADPAHRPDDLSALAQAMHHLAPEGSIPPPEADESRLDRGADFEVDVSMSMLPPAAPAALGPYDVMVRQAPAAPAAPDATSELAALKHRLESDPRPRFVVVKDGMDHGPFSAVELLQQIATHGFVEADVLRDNFSQDERVIRDWEEFAPFAEQARLNRDIKAEKEAIERVVVEERKSTRSKALFGVIAVGAVLALAATWFLVKRGTRSDRVAVQSETNIDIDIDGGVKLPANAKKSGGGRGGVVSHSGGIPILAGGMSCEGAIAAYKGDEYDMGGGAKKQADLTAGQYGAVLNNGSYLNSCGVPDNMTVSICAAVQNGRAVGVSVVTKPSSPGVASCVASRVRGMSFPSRPNLDVTRTTFAGE